MRRASWRHCGRRTRRIDCGVVGEYVGGRGRTELVRFWSPKRRKAGCLIWVGFNSHQSDFSTKHGAGLFNWDRPQSG
ncbi:hypothetical protein VTI74DRAFT_9956 [Chaetomium olivicolor]